MKSFDILDPSTDITQNLILEASAGSGKTFTLEHLVLRLLESGHRLSEMVIVTFTKQGALDLKARIGARLKMSEGGGHFNFKAFEEANISTLHAFAFKLLQENPLASEGLFLSLKSNEECLSYLEKFLELERAHLPLEKLEELVNTFPPHAKFNTYLKGPLKGFEETQKRFSTYLERCKEEEEWFTYDDLLSKLKKSLENPATLQALRERFRIGIIDEFQDTDETQWEIFQKLFLHNEARLYLVGDPKQSIYSFRGAQIYTYLEAQEKMGEESRRSLTLNWRQDPTLIKELNHLFALSPNGSFLPLPKVNGFLPVPQVAAPPGKEDSSPLGPYKRLSFFKGEGQEAQFAFIAQKMVEMAQKGVPYHEMAILVHKNSLGDEIADYLKEQKIPAQLLREKNESESEIEKPLKTVENALLNLKNDALLMEALTTPFWRWSFEDLKKLQDLTLKERVIWEFIKLKEAHAKSRTCFIGALLECRLHQKSVREELLSQPNGEKHLLDLEREEPVESLSVPPAPPQKGKVQILTLHIAKGLEYEVVFPLGLAQRTTSDKNRPPRTPEEEAELMRLFYVALTRAKRQLFIPLNFKKRPSNYQPSAVEIFFTPILPSLSYEGVRELGLEVLEESYASLELPTSTPSEAIPLAPPLEIPPLPTLLEVLSFTQLKPPSAAKQEIDYHPEDLPPGAATGILLHEIFEKISLARVKEASSPEELFPLIEPFIKYSALEMWQERICQMIYNTFNTPFSEAAFCLKEVEESKSFREIEFLHSVERGYMKGVIDWVFEHKEEVYVVDWKSNWLEDYSEESLQKTLRDEGYLLQAEIYKTAVEKFLCRFNGLKFKGVYFYFVRGGRACRAI